MARKYSTSPMYVMRYTSYHRGIATALLFSLLLQSCQSSPLNVLKEDAPSKEVSKSGADGPLSGGTLHTLQPPLRPTVVPMPAAIETPKHPTSHPNANTTQTIDAPKQVFPRRFTTSSGERVSFKQVNGNWQASLQSSPTYPPHRLLSVVSPHDIGNFLSWLQGQDRWTSSARIHLPNTAQPPYSPCVYLGKLGLFGGMPPAGGATEPPTTSADETPSKWCISYDQLLTVDQQAREIFGVKKGDSKPYTQVTMRDICESIIIPECRETGKSYALSTNPKGLDIDAFITHSWDGYFADFVQAIQEVFKNTFKNPNLWICAFALKQSDEGIDQISDAALDQSPFVRALRDAKSFCVVRNANTDLYERAWCVCELMYADDYGLFPNKTYVTGTDTFKNVQRSCFYAKASKRTDRERIIEELQKHNLAKVDEIVRKFRVFRTNEPQQAQPAFPCAYLGAEEDAHAKPTYKEAQQALKARYTTSPYFTQAPSLFEQKPLYIKELECATLHLHTQPGDAAAAHSRLLQKY